MRKLCPNFEREDCLDTVLEVPIPEEMFGATNKSSALWWQSMKGWMRTTAPDHKSHPTRNAEIQLLLGVVGAPLIPLPIPPNSDHQIVKDHPIESSMGKYIVKQYMAAVGGEKAVKSIESMYAMGKVKMVSGLKPPKNSNTGSVAGDMGGFVLWQKGPELWCLELVVAGCKISAGSDGKLAWRQTPWHHSHASRGPPRPLRRFLQGLDPASTADLFSGSACVGEKPIDGHDCFVLKLDADPAVLRSRSTASVRMMRHTLWGYFSQRTGLLVHLRDSHLLTIKSSSSDPNDNVFWETTMESSIGDYRPVEGVLIAHSGRTVVTLFRFGESSHAHSTTRMEETWEIEEVDFNIKGLSMDCFLPPGDLKQVEPRLPFQIRSASFRIGAAAAAAAAMHDSETTTDEEDDEYHL